MDQIEIRRIVEAVGRMIESAHPGIGYAVFITVPTGPEKPGAMSTAIKHNIEYGIAAQIFSRAAEIADRNHANEIDSQNLN
jgi:hypothetical protein